MPPRLARPPLFGLSIDPAAADPEDPFNRAQAADRSGLDLVTIMDHPYNAKLLDTWTLLTALAMRTERVHLGTNVICTPLRPPAMLAKMAATLDVLSGGRLELGVGAGAYWAGIEAYGGEKRSPGEAVDAFEDVLHIVRGMWDNAGGRFSYEGKFYRVKGARPGPAPAHPIRLWTGAYGPRMLGLTGRLADGVLVTTTYMRAGGFAEHNKRLDEGVKAAGRAPTDIRRGINLMGVIDLGRPETRLEEPEPGQIVGPPERWVERIVRYAKEDRQDTFIFWPLAGATLLQVEAFATEVVPAVKRLLS
jgi:alkanesulfonate monooxygenase SsuD/methylene tetrahydromethanopterin reductase-like flavin-dependent oxidoreductase (luciferase family)